MKILVLAAAITAFAMPAAAAEYEVTASNGVVLSVNDDEFAGRKEVSAPAIKFSGENGVSGFVLVAGIKRQGVLTSNLQGYIYYSGDWKRFSSALFRGGDPADFTNVSRDVSSCSGSRYGRSSCSFNEGFMIKMTAAQIAKHGENGIISIQLRAESTDTVVFQVPVNYLQAVQEIASK